MEKAIELTVSIFLLVLGASYLRHADQWLQFLREVTDRPRRLFPIALVMVSAGVFIGSAYNDWSSTWPIFITALAWLMALEGILILVFPGFLNRLKNIPDGFLRWYLRLGGPLLIVLGALLLRETDGLIDS